METKAVSRYVRIAPRKARIVVDLVRGKSVPQAREILAMRARLNEIMARHTGQSLETIARDTERDNFKSAVEAQAYGLVDQVLERRPDESIQAG